MRTTLEAEKKSKEIRTRKKKNQKIFEADVMNVNRVKKMQTIKNTG